MFSAALTVLFALVFALVFLMFFWGVVIYFWNVGTNEEGRRHGKSILLAATTALLALMLIFGGLQWIGEKIGIEVFKTN